ncbi:MAG TPA: hypothetical protein VGR02_13170 [Thermoanaerobaculia bacterium]|jgi:hypothetical protein|nr:hypothetical protein [Thermoanaerobaculia bacterium]
MADHGNICNGSFVSSVIDPCGSGHTCVNQTISISIPGTRVSAKCQ